MMLILLQCGIKPMFSAFANQPFFLQKHGEIQPETKKKPSSLTSTKRM